MKTILHRISLLSIAAALVLFCVLLSCAIQPHAKTDQAGSKNKAVVVADNKSDKPSEEKRKKVAKTTSKAKKSSAKDDEAKAVAKEAASDEKSKQEKTASPARTAVPKLDYRLGYGDVLDVKFLGSSEYNETVAVRPDGKISLQVVGDVDVLGLTPMELDTLITNVYARILVNPDVAVIVKAFGGQRCYVAGEVEKPGIIDMAKGMTLMRAIAAAGGHKKTAKLSSIILIRLDDGG
ncbi:polysaccharide biosynthesis/export family protein, partial [candidate division KSB1 bacterium]|nr:polysaccharide biosynthesis/export family protein [candidate division KSB1 bacterium]